MPRQTDTYDLQDVAADLDERLDELASDIQSSDDAEQLLAEAQQRESHLAGVEWAIDKFADDEDATVEVTLGSLTAGEFAQVRDHVDEVRATVVNGGGVEGAGARQVALAAAGVVDAPFLDEGVPKGVAGFDARRQAVADLAPQFVMWLETEVDDLSTPDVSAGNFSERLAAAAANEESTN
jgi:hypothetical protein